MVKIYKWNPFSFCYFVWHLNFYLLVCSFKHANKVKISLTELKLLDLTETQNRLEHGLHTGLLIYFSHAGILNALSGLYQTTW
jgi:hypothetical protein